MSIVPSKADFQGLTLAEKRDKCFEIAAAFKAQGRRIDRKLERQETTQQELTDEISAGVDGIFGA